MAENVHLAHVYGARGGILQTTKGHTVFQQNKVGTRHIILQHLFGGGKKAGTAIRAHTHRCDGEVRAM